MTLGAGLASAAGDPSDGAKGMPGADELHRHGNDVGHPDTFDCTAWRVGSGKTAGACQAAAAPPCEQSAHCACE